MTDISLLVLGLGWTGQFITQQCAAQKVAYAATTRDGRHGTLAWTLTDEPDVSTLPPARTVLVTFPVLSGPAMEKLMTAYEAKHSTKPHWILLSSTRPFSSNPLPVSDRHSPMMPNDRTPAEEVTLVHQGTVLHLAGLWGAQRQPRNWVARFSTEEAIRAKLLTRQLHLIHGQDVARAILAVHEQPRGGRWIVTDRGCQDWIRLFLTWASSDQLILARRLAHEDEACRTALHNATLEEAVARGNVQPASDSREFWDTFGLEPTKFLKVE
ncbi:hypothetical protein BCR43DRAFT_493071 [Syncephalastrum racemosum]|uniref:Pyrroline-5-carboxylate reductase catalytic N-terminal domain-containing protein n=1 Tax=Syncephalastrum racemosum TaxID=13706 RepID=A0A1X2HBA6_SYNRA|nr:hypothetical protein BCR43DRAFT_493071 [Syncephalastrum racemosum]